MLRQINYCVHLSKKTNRILIIDCNAGAFKNDFNKYFNIPDFEYYTNCDILIEKTNVDLIDRFILSDAKYTDDGYYLEDLKITLDYEKTLKNLEDVIFVSYFINVIEKNTPWYIKVNQNIIDDISKNKIGFEYIGLHYRNTDMKHDISDFYKEIEKYNCKNLYLSTDDCNIYDVIKNKYKNMNIIQYTKPYDNGGKNVHYGNPNKDEVIMNSLIDVYHLINSTYFIPSSKSSFSKKVSDFRIKNDFFKI